MLVLCVILLHGVCGIERMFNIERSVLNSVPKQPVYAPMADYKLLAARCILHGSNKRLEEVVYLLQVQRFTEKGTRTGLNRQFFGFG